MTLVEDIDAKQDETLVLLGTIDTNLDALRAYVLSLLNQGATTEQLQVILDKMGTIKTKTQDISTEVEAVDDPPTP